MGVSLKGFSRWKQVVPATFLVAQAAWATPSAWVPGKPAGDEPLAPPPVVGKPAFGVGLPVVTLERNGSGGAQLPPPEVAEEYLATVQLAVQEATPQLTQRSQKLVRDQFVAIFDSWPEFRGKRYEVHAAGNELVFSLVTPNDMRPAMQQAIATIVEQLNGRVRARGRTMFYRTTASPASVGGYLEVALDDSHTKIRTISAQSVALRDLLKEIRFQQQGRLSYLIPGECAQKQVDWSFGEAVGSPGKHIDAVLAELATLFDLKVEKKNGTYIFSGTCGEQRHAMRGRQVPVDAFRGGFAPMGDAAPIPISAGGPRHIPRPQVLLTLPPLQ